MTEEFEEVPWSALAAPEGPDRRRATYIAAGVIVAVALGIVGARTLLPPGSAPAARSSLPAQVAPAGEDPAAVEAPVAAPLAEAPAAPLAADGPAGRAAGLLTEADLLAGSAGDAARGAVMKAEWFVADYFTTDRDPRGSLDVRTALPGDAALPDLPHDAPTEGLSYVEWARAFRVHEEGPGVYRVAVAFRAVAGPEAGSLVRLPVRAVEVVIAVTGAAAGLAVVDLPTPVEPPLDVGYEPWPSGTQPLPPEVAAAALDEAALWGEAAEVAGGAAAGEGWRVEVTVEDGEGNRWPLALWFDGDGRVAVPPWVAAG